MFNAAHKTLLWSYNATNMTKHESITQEDRHNQRIITLTAPFTAEYTSSSSLPKRRWQIAVANLHRLKWASRVFKNRSKVRMLDIVSMTATETGGTFIDQCCKSPNISMRESTELN